MPPKIPHIRPCSFFLVMAAYLHAVPFFENLAPCTCLWQAGLEHLDRHRLSAVFAARSGWGRDLGKDNIFSHGSWKDISTDLDCSPGKRRGPGVQWGSSIFLRHVCCMRKPAPLPRLAGSARRRLFFRGALQYDLSRPRLRPGHPGGGAGRRHEKKGLGYPRP